ncbi:MAG: collagen binding domain-containing protein [Planctomycetota bacterium]
MTRVRAGLLLVFVTCVAGGLRAGRAEGEDASVVVLDARGRPLAGAVLVAPPLEREALVLAGAGEEVARADAGGRLVMRGDLAARARAGAFVWSAPGHAPARWRATASGSDVVRLLPAAEVGGRLTRDGVTLAGAVVEARAVPSLSGIAHRTSTDETGRYRFDRLHAGVWRLSFLRPDARWQTIGLARSGEAADFEISTSAELVALLLPDREEDGPVRGVRVSVVARDGSAAVSTGLSDDEGRVLVSRLEEGAYDVRLDDERWIWSGPPPRIVVDRPGRVVSATWVVVPRRTYRGRVLDAAGKPVANARIEVVDAGADPAPDDPLRARATSGEDGRFVLAGVRPDRPFRVLVMAPTAPPWLGPVEDRSNDTNDDLGDIELDRSTSLRVRATGPDGRAPPGIEMEVAPRDRRQAFGDDALEGLRAHAVADADGEARFAAVPLVDLVVVARAAGWRPARVVVDAATVKSGRPVKIDLVPAEPLAGRVLTADPRDPRRGPWVVIARPADDASAYLGLRTGADGRFRFPGLRGVTHRLEVHEDEGGAGLPLAVLDGVVPGAEDEVEIALAPRAAVAGSVSGLERRGGTTELLVAQPVPADDDDVQAPAWRTVLRLRLEPRVVEAEFRVGGLPSGVYALRARQGGRTSPPEIVVVREDDVQDVRLHVPGEASLAFRAVDGAGVGVPGLRVLAWADEGEEGDALRDLPRRPAASDIHVVLADDAGDVAFDSLAAGRWRIVVDDPRRASTDRVVVLEEGERRVLDDWVVEAGGTLLGTVLDASGLGSDGSLVIVRPLEGTASARRVRTGPDGRFRVEHLAPGSWIVEVARGLGGEGRQAVTVTLRHDEETEVELGPAGTAAVRGEIVRAGRPVAGARVLLEVRAEESEAEEAPGAWHATSDPYGRFRFEGVAVGRARLEVAVDATRIVRRFLLEEHDEEVVDIEVHDGRIVGRVQDLDGRPVTGAWVEARRPGTPDRVPALAQGKTDARGRFRLVGLALEDVDVRATAIGMPPGRAYGVRPDPPSGERETVITLGRGGSVLVTAVDEWGQGVSYAQVQIVDAAGRALLAWPRRTAAFGRVEVRGVPEGTWYVLVARRGLGSPPARAVQVREGLVSEVEIELVAPGALHVLVTGPSDAAVAAVRVAVVRLADGAVLAEGERPRRQRPGEDELEEGSGIVAVPDLAPGTYAVEVVPAPREAPSRMEVEVGEGEPLVVPFDLTAPR